MKNNKRLEEIIQKDRLLLSSETSEMICFDIKKVLNEYFNLLDGVTIKVDANDDFYFIEINAKAEAIKSFGIIK
jgi:hypothetical protein